MRRFFILCATGWGVVFPACGSLDSDTNSAPPLATLQGSVLNPNLIDVSRSSAIRVAVVWRLNGPERFNVAEDLPVQPVFPTSFSIALDAPPPAEAMNDVSAGVPVLWCVLDSGIPVSPDCPSLDGDVAHGVGGVIPPQSQTGGTGLAPDPGGGNDASAELPTTTPPIDTPTNANTASQYAVGTVVAYLDQNHNGRLDLVADDASTYVDQILAANQDMTIVYLQGPVSEGALPFAPVEDDSGHRAKDGYNLLLNPHCNVMPPVVTPIPACASVPTADAGPCMPLQWLGIDAPYPLTAASSPEVASLMCLTQSPALGTVTGMAPPFNPAIQPAQYPSPSDPAVCCEPDGSDYFYTTCVEIPQGLCKGTVESCTSVGYERPSPVPAAWPCTN